MFPSSRSGSLLSVPRFLVKRLQGYPPCLPQLLASRLGGMPAASAVQLQGLGGGHLPPALTALELESALQSVSRAAVAQAEGAPAAVTPVGPSGVHTVDVLSQVVPTQEGLFVSETALHGTDQCAYHLTNNSFQ